MDEPILQFQYGAGTVALKTMDRNVTDTVHHGQRLGPYVLHHNYFLLT
jgi:hypothetical protein